MGFSLPAVLVRHANRSGHRHRPLHLTLFECTVPYQDAVELFTHFARVYHAHCHFLGKVTSLSRLADDSKLLLWTIILIAAQHHERYHHRYLDIRLAHSRLISTTFAEAIQNPLDLQAMLLLCMWPGPVKSQWRDPTGMYLGAAIACARQMGLDKVKDEVFFGTRRAAHQLSKYQSGNLKSTWLKCFELDLQMSLWNGHLPTLAASRYLQSVKDFCRDPSVSRELANTMEIHAQTAQYLLLLDESPSQQMSWSLLTAFVQGVTSTKTANAPSWTPENDLVFHTAEMHICMTSFVRLTHDAASPDSSKDASTAYATEALQRAKECAIRIITSVSTIRKNLLGKATDVLEQSYPLPGCPKHMSYITFYAATVLLKYLDSDLDPSVAQGDARDAFQEAYLFFHSCPISREHFDAGQTLEVAGRAIGRRQAHIRSPVTTRMGSSIIYNVAWLSGLLRGRDTDQEYATGLLRSADILGETESPVAKEAVIETLKGVGPCQTTESMDSSHDWATWDKVYSDGMHFPFGVWDEALYDEWLRTTSEFDLSDWGLLSI